MTIYHTYREEEAMTIYHTYREEEAMTLRRLLAVTGTTAALTEEELDEAHDYISYNDWSAQGAAHKKMAGTSASCYPLQGQSWVASSGCAALAGKPFAVMLLRGTQASCPRRDRCLLNSFELAHALTWASHVVLAGRGRAPDALGGAMAPYAGRCP